MVRQDVLDRQYLETAFLFAALSHAKRKKVGALLVIPEGGRFEGINGMPSGFENNCEYEEYRIDGNDFAEGEGWVLDFCTPQPDGTWLTPRHNVVRKHLVTKPECLHAETNALAKVARSTQSTIGATMYTTLSPCLDCAKLMIQCGISKVVCAEVYRKTDGIDLLEKAGIPVHIMVLPRNHVGDDELTLQDEGRHYDDEDKWRGYRP